jgi:hypothetical protein
VSSTVALLSQQDVMVRHMKHCCVARIHSSGVTWHSSKAEDTVDGRNTARVKWSLCLPTFRLADKMKYWTGEHDACMEDKGNVQRR